MSGLNTFIFDGNLTRDPELRFTARGTPVAQYTVAVSKRVRNGEAWTDGADFIPVTVYGPQAERDAKHLAKGAGVTIQASVHSWYDAVAKKGGFNFVAEVVRYQGKGAPRVAQEVGAPGSRAGSEVHDEWLRAYDAADARHAALAQGQRC